VNIPRPPDELVVVGGVSVPHLGAITWPLALVVADLAGITVNVRSRRSPGGDRWTQALWSAEWGDIESAQIARRSIVFHLTEGDGCRFVTARRRRILPMVDAVQQRGVEVQRVRATLGWLGQR
jgi:hypothetical protein